MTLYQIAQSALTNHFHKTTDYKNIMEGWKSDINSSSLESNSSTSSTGNSQITSSIANPQSTNPSSSILSAVEESRNKGNPVETATNINKSPILSALTELNQSEDITPGKRPLSPNSTQNDLSNNTGPEKRKKMKLSSILNDK